MASGDSSEEWFLAESTGGEEAEAGSTSGDEPQFDKDTNTIEVKEEVRAPPSFTITFSRSLRIPFPLSVSPPLQLVLVPFLIVEAKSGSCLLYTSPSPRD